MDTLLWDSKNGLHFHLLPKELEETYFQSASYVRQGQRKDWLELLQCHFYLCILTGKDHEAKLMLQRILDKFGNNGESKRIQKMVALYEKVASEPIPKGEPTARSQFITEALAEQDALLAAKATDTGKYVELLCRLVENDPSNAEAWAELGEMYAGTGNYEQAVQAWRYVLVNLPYAYNAWARIGELRHLQAVTLQGGVPAATANLEESVQCMCKAVDLCPTYVRGWSGLYIYATKLSQWPKADQKKYAALSEKAKQKLEASNDVFAKKVVE